MEIGKGNGVSRDFMPNTRTGVNSGYILIPTGVGRDDYVLNCYRRERVSIQVENGGGVVHDCYITIQALREIKFPENNAEIGSGIIFISDPFMDRPIIIGVASNQDENTGLEEEQVRILKTKDGSYVSIVADGKTG